MHRKETPALGQTWLCGEHRYNTSVGSPARWHTVITEVMQCLQGCLIPDQGLATCCNFATANPVAFLGSPVLEGGIAGCGVSTAPSCAKSTDLEVREPGQQLQDSQL